MTSRHSILTLTCVDIDIVATYVTTWNHAKICLCSQCALSTRSTSQHVTQLAASAISFIKVSQKADTLAGNSFQFAREINSFSWGDLRFFSPRAGFIWSQVRFANSDREPRFFCHFHKHPWQKSNLRLRFEIRVLSFRIERAVAGICISVRQISNADAGSFRD